MILKEEKLSLSDVVIVPERLSRINSRKECHLSTDSEGYLPLFTAPMDTVVDKETYLKYVINGINPIIPRTESYNDRLGLLKKGVWVALGLEEFKNIFVERVDYLSIDLEYYVLIDIANGHMESTLDLIKQAKYKYPQLTIMAGNIANPKTIVDYCKANVDYVRVGIGGGSGCLTSSNTGIHYPMASLISETYKARQEFLDSSEVHDYHSFCMNNVYTKSFKALANDRNSIICKTKIVADGGMKNYDDIIKSLALGADYVMCGGIFASMFESPGDIFETSRTTKILDRCWLKDEYGVRPVKINKEKYNLKDKEPYKMLLKSFYGMSSKEAQKKMGKEDLKTSEGLTKMIEVKYTMNQWVENFKSYLSSAMSYTDSYNLEEFIGQVNLVKVKNNSKPFNN